MRIFSHIAWLYARVAAVFSYEGNRVFLPATVMTRTRRVLWMTQQNQPTSTQCHMAVIAYGLSPETGTETHIQPV